MRLRGTGKWLKLLMPFVLSSSLRGIEAIYLDKSRCYGWPYLRSNVLNGRVLTTAMDVRNLVGIGWRSWHPTPSSLLFSATLRHRL